MFYLTKHSTHYIYKSDHTISFVLYFGGATSWCNFSSTRLDQAHYVFVSFKPVTTFNYFIKPLKRQCIILMYEAIQTSGWAVRQQNDHSVNYEDVHRGRFTRIPLENDLVLSVRLQTQIHVIKYSRFTIPEIHHHSKIISKNYKYT